MIVVNNPGNWTRTFESLTHAAWNDCTPADLVFPFFVFILGAAMPFAFDRRIEDGDRGRDLYLRILRRSVWFLLLGLLLNMVAAAPAVVAMRIPGVLRRIGLVYLIAAPIVIQARPGWRLVALSALIFAHWALLTAPTFAPTGLVPTHNPAGSVDRAVLAATSSRRPVILKDSWAPWPAVATALLGSTAGDWAPPLPRGAVRVARLVAGGLAARILGLRWAPDASVSATVGGRGSDPTGGSCCSLTSNYITSIL